MKPGEKRAYVTLPACCIPPAQLRHCTESAGYLAGAAGFNMHLSKFLGQHSSSRDNTELSDVLKHSPTILTKKICLPYGPLKVLAATRHMVRPLFQRAMCL